MKEYTKPELVITLFTTEDIITASGGDVDSPAMSNEPELTNNSGIPWNDLEWD